MPSGFEEYNVTRGDSDAKFYSPADSNQAAGTIVTAYRLLTMDGMAVALSGYLERQIERHSGNFRADQPLHFPLTNPPVVIVFMLPVCSLTEEKGFCGAASPEISKKKTGA